MSDWPASWSATQLGTLIIRIEAGLNIKCEERAPGPGERGLVKISAVTWGRFDERQSKTLMPDAVVEERNQIRVGDLLISRANTIELVGASVIVGHIDRSLFLSDKVLRLVVAEPSKRWINYALKTPWMRKAIEEASSGNQLSMRNLSQDKLRSLPIPVAPLAEQQRIADKLDTVLARVDACRDRLARVAPLLKRFRQSVLAAATSGRLTKDWRVSADLHRWASASLREVVQTIDQGWSPKCESAPATSDEDWAVIKTTSIQAIKFLDYENKRLPPDLSPRPALELRPGDVLITRAGPRARAGISCLVIRTRPKLMLCDKAYRLRVDEERMKPAFLNFVLNSTEVLERIDSLKTGISESGVNLTQDRFLALSIKVPSIYEQDEIVRRVETLFAFADRLEARLGQAQTAVDRLAPSLLAKAFRGELVPQDPADEPAAELLKRLAELREDAPAQPRSRRVAA